MPKKPKHIPLRRCVVCRESKPQADLIRFVQNESRWQLDKTYASHKRKSNGRGAWVCKAEACQQKNALKRFFRQDAERIASELSAQLEVVNKKETSVAVRHVKSSAKRIRIATDGGMNV